jgi:SAM-dependent methyltransferase
MMNKQISDKWDKKYSSIDYSDEVTACSLLTNYGYLLPSIGLALDLACGIAGNAFYLSEAGLDVQAIDISQVAIDRVNQISQQKNLSIETIVRDVETTGLPSTQYDVIVVSYFLNRELMPIIIGHLKQGGLLFYQTWTKNDVAQIEPSNPSFLLDKGELLRHCKDMDILHYHEDGLIGDISQGQRNQASIIAVR